VADMTARNPIAFAAGQAHRAEVRAILERYDWLAPLATVPAAKVIRAQMMCTPLPALRTVQWHIRELARIERERLRTRNLSRDHVPLSCVQ
jgi:hypothetical protein